MNSGLLVARLPERPGALERLLGMLRRRALPVQDLSIARSGDGHIHVFIRQESSVVDRTAAELSLLFDVEGVSFVPAERAREARELVVARVRKGGDRPPIACRVLEESPTETVVEITGTSSEIDRALALWDAQGVLAGSVRTGEILLPATSSRKVESSL